MKRITIFLTILVVVATLFAGCAQSETPSITPDQTTPETAPTPGLTTPDATPAPDTTAQPSSPEASTGTLTVLVTDAPKYEVVNVVVHFLKVEVHKAGDGQGGEGGWMEIPLADPDGQTFDNSQQITLSPTMGSVTLAQDQVEAGIKYTQIRVYMDEGEGKGVTVTYIPDPEDLDENDEPKTKTVEAKLPSGELKFVRPFEVAEDAETEILLDFDLQKSVVFTGASQSEDVKVIVKPVVKLQVTILGGKCETDAELRLENKDPENNWEIIDDEIYGVLQYSTEGDMFCYDFQGYGLDDTEYSLIYYADHMDRFTNWGGDNPGALIANGSAVDGTLTLSGSVNLREDLDADGIDLPHPDDANSSYYNYKDPGDPPEYTGDGYSLAHGAKIWLVPSECYDSTNFRIYEDKWQPDRFLFETDLITFDDTDNEYEPLG